jgi:hypothetical protein
MYSLSSTTFDTKTLNKIQHKAVQAILNKLGVSKSSFPRQVAFGLKDMCGMALLGMSVKQGIRQIHYFMDHLFSRDPVGNLMLVALRSLQLESGSDLHLLENPGKWVPYLTSCWLTSVHVNW